jgi:hypothetical protein
MNFVYELISLTLIEEFLDWVAEYDKFSEYMNFLEKRMMKLVTKWLSFFLIEKGLGWFGHIR